MLNPAQVIAEELGVQLKQVEAAIGLLDGGDTVPFISRYRKEVTGALDDNQLRALESRLDYLRQLEERRTAILASIDEQGKLTPELKANILAADTKTRLEDLYLPYKQKRRTRGQIAIEAGIEPLADALFSNPALDPVTEAEKFINGAAEFKDAFKDANGVLDGAKYILMERFAEDAELINQGRQLMTDEARLYSEVGKGKEQEGAKFSDYFEHDEPIRGVPSHRALAMLRGRKEGVLQLKVDVPVEEAMEHPGVGIVARHLNFEHASRPADNWLAEVVRWTWRIKLHLHLETEFMTNLRTRAEEDAIDVFANNLRDVLLAAPAGQVATIGLDPGLRTGVKIAVIDNTGQFVANTTIYPHAPKNQWDQALHELANLAEQHQVKLLAIGNGTASRETDKLCAELIKKHPHLGLSKVVVSEAGASIYSASELAAKEFPELDVTVRGAISIARRLQDPLAELVKIEPKSIGVGQYQHDVNQVQLGKNLSAVVEDCVNAVGVEVNTASAELLKHVAGVNATLAENIVSFRNQHGRFTSREQLKQVPRLGDKAFQQAAGFLRVRDSDNPLDASAVHPETYVVVERMAEKTGCSLRELIGSDSLKSLKPEAFADDTFGTLTVTDILGELDKPGRDPRPEFTTATFMEGVETLSDLKPEMILEGTVTNVTNFGAFVDVGVHQDGLVHISALANKFVKDPREVVKAGDVVKVKVIDVDVPRKRIALSMRLTDEAAPRDTSRKPDGQRGGQRGGQRDGQRDGQRGGQNRQGQASNRGNQHRNTPAPNNAFAQAFAAAKEKAPQK